MRRTSALFRTVVCLSRHAKDYVRAMWEILQLDKPDDFVCSTGVSHTVQELCEYVFGKLGLDWKTYVKQDEKFLKIKLWIKI